MSKVNIIWQMLFMSIHREPTGVLDNKPVWVGFYKYSMYAGYSFLELLKIAYKEWDRDKNIIG